MAIAAEFPVQGDAVKRALCLIALMSFGLVACSNSKKTTAYGPTDNDKVTDVTAPVAAAPSYQAPVAAQPVVYDTMSTQTPASSGAVSSGSYTVKKGDTLYGIARQRYGDGKQWTKIAAANPGLKPNTLKVGQTIQLP